MLKNYFRAALRNFRKSRLFSFINISGLSIGMAVALLIGLWIWDELSFDTYHANYRHIAQIMESQTLGTGVTTLDVKPFPLAKELRDKYGADFKQVAAFNLAVGVAVSTGPKKLIWTGCLR